MARTAITPDQKILDTFAEMETDAQAAVLEKLQEMHRFCVKRDGRQRPATATPKKRQQRAPAESDEQPPLLAAEPKA
jgi:hypothetical protein